MAAVLDGKGLAAEIRGRLKARIDDLGGRPPGLTLFRVGDDPASVVYVRNKQKACEEVGIRSSVLPLSGDTPEAELIGQIEAANQDPNVDGILVQLPLPAQIRAERAVEAIAPAKDVDGLHPASQGRLALGRPLFVPCTPLGIYALLRRHAVPIEGSRVVVLGRSSIVGRPASILFGLKGWGDATVTVLHTRSSDIERIAREADILIAAMGVPRAVSAAMVKPGAAVVDVGIHRVDDPARPGQVRLVGDVDAEAVAPIAGWLSPVPGGVGPLTVVMLLANTVQSYERGRGIEPQSVWDLRG